MRAKNVDEKKKYQNLDVEKGRWSRKKRRKKNVNEEENKGREDNEKENNKNYEEKLENKKNIEWEERRYTRKKMLLRVRIKGRRVR